MADKPIGQLPAAPSNLQLYSGTELLVLEQDGTAKKLTMQILENWLVSFADGHGGIQTISKTGTSGLVDTYTITFADQSAATFTVTNGNGITGVTQYWAVSSSNTTVPSSWSTTRQTMTPTNKYLWSYMTFTRDSGSFSTTKSVVGVYGDTGQAWYVWIRYAGQRPTSDSDIGTEPDNWMGVYSGAQATAPTSYTAYQWFEIKGEIGNTGATGASIASITRTGGTGEPGSTDIYTVTLDNGTVAGTFTVYNGLNGSGAVATVNGVQPDGSGNVTVAATDIQATSGTVQSNLDSLQTAVNSKQGTISANGVLRGNGSGSVTAATLGSDYTAIDDSLSTSTVKTYSIDKINSLKPTGLVSYAESQTLTDTEKERARENIEAAREWTTVWTNASPTDAFVAQTIPLDLSGFTEARIYYKQYTGSSIFYTNDFFTDGNAGYLIGFGDLQSAAYTYTAFRQVTVSNNAVVFDGAYTKKNNSSSAATVDNTRIVPTEIYAR